MIGPLAPAACRSNSYCSACLLPTTRVRVQLAPCAPHALPPLRGGRFDLTPGCGNGSFVLFLHLLVCVFVLGFLLRAALPSRALLPPLSMFSLALSLQTAVPPAPAGLVLF